MVTAFKERSLTHQPGQPVRPFHLFLDEFQSLCAGAGSTGRGDRPGTEKVRSEGPLHQARAPRCFLPRCETSSSPTAPTSSSGGWETPKTPRPWPKPWADNNTAPAYRQDHENYGSTPIESRNLLGMPQMALHLPDHPRRRTLISVLQLKGINADQTWNHLRTDHDITQTNHRKHRPRTHRPKTRPPTIPSPHASPTGSEPANSSPPNKQHNSNSTQPPHRRPQPPVPCRVLMTTAHYRSATHNR